jgi:hypothetical protein
MNMKEFRLSLPNQPGELAKVAEALGQSGINLLAIAGIGAATPVLALVTEQEDQTRNVLQGLGISFQEEELLTVKVPDRPGELGKMARKLGDAQVNIDSIYLLSKAAGEAELAFTVSDLAQAKQLLGL